MTKCDKRRGKRGCSGWTRGVTYEVYAGKSIFLVETRCLSFDSFQSWSMGMRAQGCLTSGTFATEKKARTIDPGPMKSHKKTQQSAFR